MTLRARQWSECLLAIAMSAIVVLELATAGRVHSPLDPLLGAAVGLPLALRFRVPLVATALTGAAAVLLAVQVDHAAQLMSPVICLLLALYAVGSRTTGWRLVVGGLIAGGAVSVGLLIENGATDDLALAVVLPIVGLMIGRASGVLQLETEVLETRATRIEQERDEYTRAAIREERSRIARELHDVIGHSISIMGLQAGAVRSVLPPEREQERAALLAVERTGREAVGEMHRLIDLLRPEDDAAGGQPSPSLARIEALAADMRAAGQRLTLTVDGDVAHLPAGVDLAGYRIVQEALTNALKHAPGASVRARVALVNRMLELAIVNTAGDPVPPRRTNGRVGNGLLGMRERAVLYGGEVKAEPRPDGGFSVHARLPVEVL